MRGQDIPSQEAHAQKQDELEARCQVNGGGTHGCCCHPVLTGAGPARGAPPSPRQVGRTGKQSHTHLCSLTPGPGPHGTGPFTPQSAPRSPAVTGLSPAWQPHQLWDL